MKSLDMSIPLSFVERGMTIGITLMALLIERAVAGAGSVVCTLRIIRSEA
jgi:hypothetical protein